MIRTTLLVIATLFTLTACCNVQVHYPPVADSQGLDVTPAPVSDQGPATNNR